MIRFPQMLADSDRLVVGYHGTSAIRAEVILRERLFFGLARTTMIGWDMESISREEAPCRAWRWAGQKYGQEAAVVQAYSPPWAVSGSNRYPLH